MANIDKVTLNGTDYTIVDSTVPSWAKQSTKPTYNGGEVKYTGTTGNVVTNNTTLNVAVQALDGAMGDILTALNTINGDGLMSDAIYFTWDGSSTSQVMEDGVNVIVGETAKTMFEQMTYEDASTAPKFFIRVLDGEYEQMDVWHVYPSVPNVIYKPAQNSSIQLPTDYYPTLYFYSGEEKYYVRWYLD